MEKLDLESGAVHSYLETLQNIVSRMSTNSASCKSWCVTLVSAIIVIVADKSRPELIWIAIIPISLFLFLDSYYLGLEQRFRLKYNEFIKKLHNKSATIEDVFIINSGSGFKVNFVSTIKALLSFSVYPFYIVLFLMLIVTKNYII